MNGLCECGCGQPTSGRQRSGRAVRFIVGHNNRVRGPGATRWKGGRTTTADGYVWAIAPGHPRGKKNYVEEHILIVERAMGKLLRADAEVHHVNGDRGDNRNRNLVACHDGKYHMLLHVRQRALDECGNANWRKCCVGFCGQYDDPDNMTTDGRSYWHRKCHARAARERQARKRMEVAV